MSESLPHESLRVGRFDKIDIWYLAEALLFNQWPTHRSATTIIPFFIKGGHIGTAITNSTAPAPLARIEL